MIAPSASAWRPPCPAASSCTASPATTRSSAKIMCALGLACRHGSPATSKIVESIPHRLRTGIECLRERTEDDLLRIKRAQALWNEAADPRGTRAVQYLTARALDLPDDLAGAALRFHPRCPWRNEDTGKTERIPALLAAFESIDTDDITAIHRIRLDQPQRWPKADRRMLGLVHRAAVKLDPVATTLIIGEGVETCMAARQCMATGDLERAPVWALGSVGAISFFPVLDGVKRLIILGESGEASAQAVRLCGRRWQHAGRRVQVLYSEIGSDVNDALMMEKIAQ